MGSHKHHMVKKHRHGNPSQSPYPRLLGWVTLAKCFSIFKPLCPDLQNKGGISMFPGNEMTKIKLWQTEVFCVVASRVSTFFKESNRFIIKPGSPQFSYPVVDIVAFCWKLVFGVKVMISQSSIDFSIWKEKEKFTYL